MKNNSTPNQSRVEEYVLIEYLMAFLPADQPDGDDVLLKAHKIFKMICLIWWSCP